jgi:hypothetical protein
MVAMIETIDLVGDCSSPVYEQSVPLDAFQISSPIYMSCFGPASKRSKPVSPIPSNPGDPPRIGYSGSRYKWGRRVPTRADTYVPVPGSIGFSMPLPYNSQSTALPVPSSLSTLRSSASRCRYSPITGCLLKDRLSHHGATTGIVSPTLDSNRSLQLELMPNTAPLPVPARTSRYSTTTRSQTCRAFPL